MNDRVKIRVALRSDAADLHGMVKALAKTTGLEHKISSSAKDFLYHGFEESRAFEALIAEQDGKPVGLCLFFYTFSSWRGKLGVYIQDLYVDESQRGTGLGRRLVVETVRCGKQQGADHLRLSVDSENVGAHAFYEHIGMSRRDDEFIFQAADQAFENLARDKQD